MHSTISNSPWRDNTQLRMLMEAFQSDGHQIRLVGGCVRDAILGKTAKDIDLATTALPADSVETLKARSIGCIPTGISHGTITAVMDGQCFEITTLRTDSEQDGRHATVSFTDDWKQDAARRDFTFNAMYSTWDGVIYDPFYGLEDLKKGIVRFIGNPSDRIREDYLRVFRYYRFLGRYSFGADILTIHNPSYHACAANARMLHNLSAERVRNEILQILVGPNADSVLMHMYQSNALRFWISDSYQAYHINKLKRLINREDEPDAIRRLAAVIGDYKQAHIIAWRWKLSKRQTARLNAATDVSKIGDQWTADVYRNGKEAYIDRTMIYWPDTKAALARCKEVQNWEIPTFPLSGKDIIDLGISPGPRIKELLNNAEFIWVDQNFIPTKDMLISSIEETLWSDAAGAAGSSPTNL